MKILLTGHRGFIGSHLLTSLEDAGHEVDTFEWEDGNLPSIMEQDWVIHVGAISSTTERDIEKVMRQNVDFSIELYNACKTFGVNFQFASSASVYGMNKEFTETSPLDPRTPYAWSKYLVERHIERHPMGARAQVFRYFNVYGPGEDHKGTQASPFTQFAKQATIDGKIRVFENSENYCRDFIHVDTIVAFHMMFLDVAESGVWNFGTGGTMSFLDIAKQYNVPIETIPMPEQLKHSYQEYTCADVRKLARTIAPIAQR